jgi:hypothetical protein
MNKIKILVLVFLWCAVTFSVARLAGLFFLEWRFMFMFWAGMAYLEGSKWLCQMEKK